MKKIQLSGTDLVKDVIIISNELEGDLSLHGGCSYTKFSNDFGKGTITGIRVSDEISALIFDVVFNLNMEFEYSNDAKEFIDMFFCLEGSLMHKINAEKQFEKINFRQNTLIKRLKSTNNTISFLPHVTLKMSFISYSISDDTKSGIKEYQNLRQMASNALNTINTLKNYRYLGRICFRTSDYMQKIMSFSFENASDILFKEAAILNTLASQLERYDQDSKSEYADAPIKQYELDKILAIESFIKNNLTENLAIHNLECISGLGASKLQLGFNYLYDTTVNGYITKKRLEKASELIQDTELNISEIVYQIGFSSRSYFSKIFKSHFGMSPSEALKKPNTLNI
jgi:AraC-like DNA-binding protein